MIRESVGWLETVLIGAQNARWCTRPFCTTCGCLEFKRAYWAAAAQEAGIDSRFDTAHHPSEILTGVSAVDRETMVRTLVTGLRALPPGWTDTDAFRIIIIDLYPPLIKHGIPMVLDAELSGTPAGEALGRMRAHYAEVREHLDRRKAYESPHAVEERKRVRREKRAIAHGNRQTISRQRNAKRLE